MRRKETCALSFIVVIIILPPTYRGVCSCTSKISPYLSISSSLHTCTLQRPLDRCKPQSGLLVVAVSIFPCNKTKTKTKKEIKTKTKMCADACETGSVDLGGWMNATYMYIYGPLSYYDHFSFLYIQSTKSYREVKRLV